MEISSAPYQAMVGYGLEEGAAGPKPQLQQQHSQEQRRPARPPQSEQALKCPRCASTNTKFCYYNNYSLSQPRYFCKGCRRYWTQGGSLRNVPVGGGCRKNKRPTSSSSSKKTVQDQDPTTATTRPLLLPSLLPPPLPFDPSDLTLAFAAQTPIKQASIEDSSNQNLLGINTNIRSSLAPAQDQNGFHDILRTGFIDISSMYYGGNGEETGLLPFEDGVGGAAASSGAEEASCKVGQGRDGDRMLMGLPWQLDAGSVLDSGRDCGWINGVGSSTWQGLINSSLL